MRSPKKSVGHGTPLRHISELATILENMAPDKPVLFLYSDGGPDHRVTYLSVKLALIALFKKLNLDYLCATRTAPYHSYRNPVERIMSILNLGLQAVALAREKMPEEFEAESAKCNSLKALRAIAERNPDFHGAAIDTMVPVKLVLTDLSRRLELKEKKFAVFSAAADTELDELWTALPAIDAEFPLSRKDKVCAKDLSLSLSQFTSHCCRQRHYVFDILKCGQTVRNMPPSLTSSSRVREVGPSI